MSGGEVRYDWLTQEIYEKAVAQVDADWQAAQPEVQRMLSAWRRINEEDDV